MGSLDLHGVFRVLFAHYATALVASFDLNRVRNGLFVRLCYLASRMNPYTLETEPSSARIFNA